MRLSACLLVTITLFGCSDGSDGPDGPAGGGPVGSPFATAPVGGTVVVPAGLGLAPDRLAVENVLGSVAVEPSGAFLLDGFQAGPVLSVARDGAGAYVLMGWLGGGRTELSARTTAEVLLYMYAGLFLVPDGGAVAVLDEVAASAEADAVEALVLAAIAGGARNVQEITAATGADIRAAARALTAVSAVQGTLIDPVGARSGIHVDAEGFNSILVTNRYRRRAHLWIERVGYTTEGGAFVEDPAPVLEQGISPTAGYTDFWDLFTKLGTGLHIPVKVGPVPTPLEPADAQSTAYRVTVVGLGASAGAFNRIANEQALRHATVAAHTLFIDMFLPTFFNAALPKTNAEQIGQANRVSFEQFRTVAEQIVLKYPEITAKAAAGDIAGALGVLAVNVAGDAPVLSLVLAAIEQWLEGRVAGSTLDVYSRAAGFLGEFSQKTVAWADFLGSLGDLAVQATHINYSNNADVWEVEITGSKVSLTPQVARSAPGDTVAFEARVQDAGGDPNVVFAYTWTCGELGKMTDTKGHFGRSFDSSDGMVNYFPEPGASGTDHDTVEVFEVVGQERRPVGKARARVEVRRSEPVLLPEKASVQPGGSQEFEVRMVPEPDGSEAAPEQVFYVFTSPEAFGTLVGAGARTPRPQATYQAGGTEGVDTVTVEVFEVRNGEEFPLGTASASIRVETEPTILPASFSVDTLSGDGVVCVYARVPFSPPANATGLTLNGVGGFDPDFFGSRITMSATRRGDGSWNWGFQHHQFRGDYWLLSGSCGSGQGDLGPIMEVR